MFDAIVVGSGMSGGWVAKELTERGLKVLVVERGPNIDPRKDYTDNLRPWELENTDRIPEDEVIKDWGSPGYGTSVSTRKYWSSKGEFPFSTPDGKPFRWIRGYHLGGKSIMWARQSYRWSDLDFEANKKDGHGVDWPIRYADLKPWYDHVEEFAGISGSTEGLPQLPDGKFLPPMGLNDCELDFKAKVEAAFPGRNVIPGRTANLSEARPQHTAVGRTKCQYRSICARGCRYGAYFSALTATLPAARLTKNLTIVTDAIVHSVTHDPKTRRATGVRVIDANTREGRTYEGKVIFLCASTIATTQILLNSTSEAFQNGLANSSDMVGRNLMDHIGGPMAIGEYPGLEDSYYSGRRPTNFYIPRFRNVTTQEDYLRGYAYQCVTWRKNWQSLGMAEPGVGQELKSRLRKPGSWMILVGGGVEMLPDPKNRVTLHPTKVDKWDIPLVHIDCEIGDNERKLVAAAQADATAMVKAAGGKIVMAGGAPSTPGNTIHEMGTARMGRDPKTSVLNKYSQAHDVPNLFITDGASMTSSACQNPSLTFMALSARGADHAAEMLREGNI